MIKRYEVPNLLLDDIHWKDGKSLTYKDVKKRQISKICRRGVQILTINKREMTNSFFHLFM